MDRPMLLPHIRLLWRDQTTLQLGTDPERAVLVEFGQPYAAHVVALVDGSRTVRALVAEAAGLGVSAAEVEAVLAALRRSGVLVGAHAFTPPGHRHRLGGEAAALANRRLYGDADQPEASPARILRRRATSSVLVAGQARLAAPIAVALATAGVGRIGTHVAGTVTERDLAPGGLSPADVGRPAAAAIADLAARAAPGLDTALPSPDEASLLVQVGTDATPAVVAAQRYARRRLPHLAVTVRDAAVVIGPFVPATGSPCLACLDLHRTDRDPAWRALAAQLATAGPPGQLCSAAALLVGVGYAVADATAHLDGGTPRTRATTIEVDGTGAERMRRWIAHPRCDCRRGRRRPAAPGKN